MATLAADDDYIRVYIEISRVDRDPHVGREWPAWAASELGDQGGREVYPDQVVTLAGAGHREDLARIVFAPEWGLAVDGQVFFRRVALLRQGGHRISSTIRRGSWVTLSYYTGEL